MKPGTSALSRRRTSGSSAVDYIIALVLVAVASIGAYKALGKQLHCKIGKALGLFETVNGDGSKSVAGCDDTSGGGSGSGGGGSSGDGSGGDGSGGGGPPAPGSGGSALTTSVNCNACKSEDGCFVAGTPVMTSRGPVPIEAIEVGMLVLSRGEEEGPSLDYEPVTATTVHSVWGAVRLTLVDERGHEDSLTATLDHPFHVDGRGWVRADALQPERDRLVDADGAPLWVRAAESLDEGLDVYNFNVADDHTYFVGELHAWVHNGKCTQDQIDQLNNDAKSYPAALTNDPNLQEIIRRNRLQVVHATDDSNGPATIELQAPPNEIHQHDPPPDPPNGQQPNNSYWYRSMSMEEFNQLNGQRNSDNPVSIPPNPNPSAYGGVADNFNYSHSPTYFGGGEGQGRVIVEFHAPDVQPTFKKFGSDGKGEGGKATSFGLGPQGTPLKPGKNGNPVPPGGPLGIFNDHLQDWRVVGLNLPNPLYKPKKNKGGGNATASGSGGGGGDDDNNGGGGGGNGGKGGKNGKNNGKNSGDKNAGNKNNKGGGNNGKGGGNKGKQRA